MGFIVEICIDSDRMFYIHPHSPTALLLSGLTLRRTEPGSPSVLLSGWESNSDRGFTIVRSFSYWAIEAPAKLAAVTWWPCRALTTVLHPVLQTLTTVLHPVLQALTTVLHPVRGRDTRLHTAREGEFDVTFYLGTWWRHWSGYDGVNSSPLVAKLLREATVCINETNGNGKTQRTY